MNTTSDIAATGATFEMKSMKLKARRAMRIMILGGSPISVAVPPMFEASAQEIRYGTGRYAQLSRYQQYHGSDQQHGGDVIQEARSAPP